MKQLPSHRFLFLSLCLTLTLFNQSVLAQKVKDDWNSVQKIKQGSKLIIKTKTGQKYQGYLKTITDDSLSLSDAKGAGQEVMIRRGEIAEIRKISGAQTAKMAALLGGLGFAGGYGIGYGIGEAKDSRFRPEYATAAVGAAAGAVLGAIIGSKGQVIYKAR
jgi:hypothetical protein